MTACKPARDPCVGTVWGLDGGTCFANAPATGSCDAGGVCQPDACAQGEKLVACDAACIYHLLPIAPRATPSNGSTRTCWCAQDGPRPLQCKPECVFGQSEDIQYDNSCQMGLCVPLSMMCGNYKCQGPKCGTSCMSSDDCKPGEKCEAGTCD